MKKAFLIAGLALSMGCSSSSGGKSVNGGTTSAGGSGDGGASTSSGAGGMGGSGTPSGGVDAATSSVGSGGSGGTTTAIATGGRGGTTTAVATGGSGGTTTSLTGGSGGGNGGAISHGGVPSGTPVALADYATEYAAAVCDSVADCCQASPYGWDRSGCLSSVSALYSGYEALLLVGSVRWDAEAAGTCIAYVRRNYTGCNPPPDLDMDRVCGNLFVGSRPLGAPCTSQYQCASPATGEARCMQVVSDASAGLFCVARPSTYDRGKLGDPCHESCTYSPIGIGCTGSTWKEPSDPSAVTTMPATCYANDGLRCAPSTGKCVALAQNGEACSGSGDCTNALYCKSGRCAPREALGTACTRTSAACGAGAYCDPQSLTCVSALSDGSTCKDSGMCLSGFCQSGTYVCGQGRLGFASAMQCTGKR